MTESSETPEEVTPETVEEPERELPRLPLLFTARDGEKKQIGEVELQMDGTFIGRVYKGGEGALPPIFSISTMSVYFGPL